MADLLLELFSEEIPARMQTDASKQLEEAVTKGLKAAGITFKTAKSYSTPRRLALHLTGLPLEQPDVREERKGPRVGAPEKALEGFLKAAGVASIDDCQMVEDKKGAYYVAVIERKGGKTSDVIATLVPEVIRSFHWPKSMRWGSGSLRWVRPLHSILCTLDGKVVPFEVDGIASGDTTYGHRFHAPDAIKAPTIEEYLRGLEGAHVVLRRTDRKAKVWDQAVSLASAAGLEVTEDPALLREVVGLVEWPVVLMGSFDEAFLDVPPEVLITAMRSHQKYFAVRDPKTGKLANKFIFVANLQAEDGGKAITAGNERVLRARLSDAKFFWDQDRKIALKSRVAKLEKIVFYDKLGTVFDKVDRLQDLTEEVAECVKADIGSAISAAALCKSDLVSDMVFEFPELQGLMGQYYALDQEISSDIAQAIKDHYSPLGPNDFCPSSPVSVSLAIADKVDTLVGFWAIDQKPTGSKDPFALRRAALGTIRLILENGVRIGLIELFEKALRIWASPQIELIKEIYQFEGNPAEQRDFLEHRGVPFIRGISASTGVTTGVMSFPSVFHFVASSKNLFDEVTALYPVWATEYEAGNLAEDLLAFFADRLKVYLRDKGARHDLIDAVFALGGQDDLVLIVARVDALGAFLDTDDGKNLLAGYKRAVNILRIEEKKDGKRYDGLVNYAHMHEDAEIALDKAIDQHANEAKLAIENENFVGAMASIAQLRAPVDKFFDDVKVNDDDADVRANRLNLLNQIRAALGGVADFSKIEG